MLNPYGSFPVKVYLKKNNPWSKESIIVNSILVTTNGVTIHSQSDLDALVTIEKYIVIKKE